MYESITARYMSHHFSPLAVSAFYGCPCATKDEEDAKTKHVVECPQHPCFYLVDSLSYPYDWKQNAPEETREEHGRAYAHHLARLSYYDVHGDLLHGREELTHLWVMLITPSPDDREKRKVYQRLGIGRIYLKRWVEASPSFESIVLV
jgi:hypothetical protein